MILTASRIIPSKIKNKQQRGLAKVYSPYIHMAVKDPEIYIAHF